MQAVNGWSRSYREKCHHFLVDISAPKKKKKFSPPPPQNQNPQFAADTLPAPRPLLLETPPFLGFSKKNRRPPLPAASDSPFPLPEPKKNQEDVNGEKLTVKKWWIFGADFSRFMQSFSRFIRDINGETKKTFSLLMVFFTVSFSRFTPSRKNVRNVHQALF